MPNRGHIVEIFPVYTRYPHRKLKTAAGYDYSGYPVRFVEFWNNHAEHFLQEESADPGACVNGGENEDRFKT